MSEKIRFTREQIHSCLLYEFCLGTKAIDAHRRLCQAFGDDVVSMKTCYNWFSRFSSGDYSVEDKSRSGRPPEFDDDTLRELVKTNPRLTTRELSTTMGCSHTAIENHLAKMGIVSKLGCWVPHVLTQKDRDKRSETCTLLLSRRRNFKWLDSILTGDEKWVLYVNHTRKRQWVAASEKPQPQPKGDLHPKKVMLSVWWDTKGVVYWELLPPNATITAAYYCNQLQRLREEFQRVRAGHGNVLFLHDNARPHIAKITRLKLLELGWEILPHPPYSPDLAPSDYHLFRSLQNHLNEKKFDDCEDLKSFLHNFFTTKPVSFYHDGIHALPTRWRQVVDRDGQYLID